MSELTLYNNQTKNSLDSREVAEMVGKEHKHLMRDIRGYCEVLSNSTESKIGLSEFFLESQYKDSTGRTLPLRQQSSEL
jgi:phage regulator Rha-like protein